MRVTGWHNGGKMYGIRIGINNRDEFFKRAWNAIRIDLDGQVYDFLITGGFWKHCAEIRDRDGQPIQDWLKKHRLLGWPKGKPPKMELVPVGEALFRLLP